MAEIQKPLAPNGARSETIVNVNTDFKTAVGRLRELNGWCDITDHEGDALEFYSTWEGRFGIRNRTDAFARSYLRPYTVRGALYTEAGRTKAVVYEVENKTPTRRRRNVLLWYLELSLILTSVWVSAYFDWTERWLMFLLVGIPLSLMLVIMLTARHQESTHERRQALAAMRQDVLRRLDAVNRWEKEI